MDRCNFRCPYCMPASEYHEDYEFLTRPECLTHGEILAVARAAAGLGVSKLRLTGGEPLLYADLDHVLRAVPSLKFKRVIFTTNGLRAGEHLDALADAGGEALQVAVDGHVGAAVADTYGAAERSVPTRGDDDAVG